MDKLTGADVRAMLLYTADKIIESKPLLTEVDSAIGDGDHGIGMARGMESVKEAFAAQPELSEPYALFSLAGRSMLMSMGGASGVIFGSMFMGGAKGQEPAQALDAAALAALFRRSLAAVQTRGGAARGDKTMVDALAPAVDAMEASAPNGLEPMLSAAESAALEGVEYTKGLTARFGRAKSLMERAVGFQDAGATSVWIIFRSMHEWVQGV